MGKGYILSKTVVRNGKRFRIVGQFGNVSVYDETHCLVFGIMTTEDAENWIWKNY